jgi:predicted AAA+ superfamily ATPase
MIVRILKHSKSNSFFIFGPRGSGKSTWLKKQFLFVGHNNLYINLLQPKTEDRYYRNPESLSEEIRAHKYDWIIIDEIQKLPRLLDIVHDTIEEHGQNFILTGSSARKLKRGAANLLAGRAFVYYLFPFNSLELKEEFNLETALNWGLLPKIYHLDSIEDRKDFLESYCLTYLKEEIVQEQIIRKLDPFRLFLEVAAQMNGRVINFSKIAKEISVDTTTVQNYYSILEDTLVGFHLNAYHSSIRKRIIQAPKFYFFDTGVVRCLSRTMDSLVVPRTSDYGRAFEHFIILEIWKLSRAFKKSWSLSYLLTKDGVEIDLILESSSKDLICIEIKSSEQITESDIAGFIKITSDLKAKKSFCFSRDLVAKKIAHVSCLNWQKGLEMLFTIKSTSP